MSLWTALTSISRNSNAGPRPVCRRCRSPGHFQQPAAEIACVPRFLQYGVMKKETQVVKSGSYLLVSSVALLPGTVLRRPQGVTVVLENMSSVGNIVGGRLWHLRYIIDRVVDKSRIGFCIDTCHLFSSGGRPVGFMRVTAPRSNFGARRRRSVTICRSRCLTSPVAVCIISGQRCCCSIVIDRTIQVSRPLQKWPSRLFESHYWEERL